MNRRLASLLFLVALPGVIAVVTLALPRLVDAAGATLPLARLQLAAGAQSLALLALASAGGALLAPRVGLFAPRLAALAGAPGPQPGQGGGLGAATAGGIVGAAIILAFQAGLPLLAPDAVSPRLPLAVRLLYGGVTEEVLMRWGVMTTLAWAGTRLLRVPVGDAPPRVMWAAIVLSAVLFGLGHVPALLAGTAGIGAPAIVAAVAANALFGVVAGYLFWRHGLEMAMAAHLLAHALAWAIGG